MNPRIRYTRSCDGVDIAYWRVGEGPVLIQTPLIPYSHIEMEWQIPELRAWYERLGRGMSLVRYDSRGTGLSQREVDDLSLDAHVADLEAVVEAVGPDPATVMGVFHAGPASIALAGRRPELVARLILWCTFASGADYWRGVQSEGLRALRQTAYPLFLRTAAHELFGWEEGARATSYADLMEAAVAPEMADRLIAATHDFDVQDLLSAVDRPTLVVHRRDLDWIDVGLSRRLAGGIADARLAIVEGRSPLPGTGDVDSSLGPIDDFLERTGGQPAQGGHGPVQIVLFTDLVDHTAMMSALGDLAGREVLRRHESIVSNEIEANGGRSVKGLGDGFMAVFGSVGGAIQCAVAIQREFAAWNAESERKDRPVEVRIGLHAGEPIEEDGDLFGATVILASRITGHAGAGEILAGNTVKELAAGKRFVFAERDDFVPKGFEDPVQVWTVEWRE